MPFDLFILLRLFQLSLQDYSRLGITDTVDRRKIFGLVQSIRKESTNNNSSNMGSGLRQPQNYGSSSSSSRLPQPDPHNNNNTTTSSTRSRRQSIIGNITKSPTQMQQQLERPIRSRTMSDAPRPDPNFAYQQQQQQRQAPLKDRRSELRRSLYLEQPSFDDDHDDDDEEEEMTKNRKYRASAPLLDAYGVPVSSMKQQQQQQRASLNTGVFHNLPPSDLNQKIRVCVRKRPLSRKELEKQDKDVAPLNGTRSLQINEPK